MGFARQILAEAADRFEFQSSYRGIKSLRAERPDMHPFSLEEVQRILNRVRSDFRHYLAMRLLTGMRRCSDQLNPRAGTSKAPSPRQKPS